MADPEEPVADASAADAPPVSTVPPSRVVKDIVYCGVCLMPVEYCEFDVKTLPRCKAWLKAEHGDLYEKYYAADAAADKLKETTLGDTPEGEAAAPAEGAAPEKPKKESKDKKKKAPKVVIETISRNKRKHVTTLAGLEFYDIDMKKTAKTFASKFACGSSVSKNAEGKDEIVVQGEFAVEIAELLESMFPQIPIESITIKEPKSK